MIARHALVAQCHGAAHALVDRHEFAARGVGEDPVLAAAEHLPEGLIARSPYEIPNGDLERPAASVMEVDGLEDPVDDVGARRIESDEQPLEELAVGQAVAARVAFDAVIRADDNDRCVLVRAWPGVPGNRERRIERKAIPPRLDRSDAH